MKRFYDFFGPMECSKMYRRFLSSIFTLYVTRERKKTKSILTENGFQFEKYLNNRTIYNRGVYIIIIARVDCINYLNEILFEKKRARLHILYYNMYAQ